MFNVGDSVRITDAGALYDTYGRWIEKYLPEKFRRKWTRGYHPRRFEGRTAIVLAKGIHERPENGMLYAIQHENRIFIIGERGIKKLSC